ncbi:GGDEF domain-containing protein [Psychromonas sp. psych-6C06]|uniref:GGDEF domain-containing protein n=1 Tax=Psychromonas sp. psych-6C06 TaxID=2058089 RepID=UPI00187CF356|nr:GGDEF domain-containing protein [Psychromonas sp. psych-6C06]
MLIKTHNLLSWSERATGRALVHLVVMQQAYLSILALHEHVDDDGADAELLKHYDLAWSAYETLINGTRHAYFMHDPQNLADLKVHFKTFKKNDPKNNALVNDKLRNALQQTQQAHTYLLGLLNHEFQGFARLNHERDIKLVNINHVLVSSLFGVSFSTGLFLFIIFRDRRRMAYLAYHDALTGIANRVSLKEKITQLQNNKVDFCSLLIDIDGFKSINDTYGHDIGDELLIHLANEMKAVCGERHFLGRLGGDEFAIVHLDRRGIEQMSQQLLTITANKIVIKGCQCDVGLSIGISCAMAEHESWVDVLKSADDAMYTAKERGGNQYQMHE